MNEQPPMSPTYQPLCATCRHGGRPQAVSIFKGQRTISYKCEACGAEWTDTQTDTEPLLTLKPIS